MDEKVLSEIVNLVKLAKYFSISVDSTPDVSHIDQLTLIMRYVSPDGQVEERLLEFLPITSHVVESLFNAVMGVLNELGIDIQTVMVSVTTMQVICLAYTRVYKLAYVK